MNRRTTTPALILLGALSMPSSAAATPKRASGALRPLAELAAERRTRPLTAFSELERQLFVYERETLRGIQTGRIDEMMDVFIGKDAIVCPPGMDTIVGRDRQKALFARWLGTPGVLLDYEPVDVHVSASGDMGWVYGLVRWQNPGEPVHLGKYLSIWTKEDGRWMNQAEMRNDIRVERKAGVKR